MLNPFVNRARQLRSGWWIGIFFLVLAAFLVPLLLFARQEGAEVSIPVQAVVVIAASFVCQALIRRPIGELIGPPTGRWVAQLATGGLMGIALMLLPALTLAGLGVVRWDIGVATFATLMSGVGFYGAVAVTEEVMFRGFVFQRLHESVGAWPTQVITSCYFLLTHSAALGEAGALRWLAAANIFLASIMFGLARLRTRSLAMPLGMHFGANFTQGTLLGFGVSGQERTALLEPSVSTASDWLTGGAFGLEASVPGLLGVIAVVVLLGRWKGGS